MFDFSIQIIEHASPSEASGGAWHRYVIANGITRVEGLRVGSRDDVAQHARECVQRLNNRFKHALRW